MSKDLAHGDSLPHDGRSKPTDRQWKFVPSEGERSRASRQIVAAMWRSVRRQLPVPEGTGDISLWVCQLLGLGLISIEGEHVDSDGPYLEAEAALQALGPEASPEKLREKFAALSALKSGPHYANMMAAVQAGDFAAFDAAYTEGAKRVGQVLVPDFRPPFPVSFDSAVKMNRASRACLVCMTLLPAHPWTLIARALKGDQNAVLDLVKADKVFLQDRCTQDVIRQAGLRNDGQFMARLAAAQKYQPRLRRRDLIHVYFTLLFSLELAGQPLPRIDELQRLLDPEGKIFEGTYAFEKDLQRQRELYMKMWGEAFAELPDLLAFYKAAVPGTS